MPDPQTANLQLYIPLNGADINAWDVPVNNNMALLDAALGQTASIAVTNVNITLSPAQYSCGTIIFTGNQTADVQISFPAFGRIYNVLNLCDNNNTWVIYLRIGANPFICAPPGEMITVHTDGTNFRYISLERVGSYWDYSGSSVPRWVSQCSVPPYLNCDGAAFNAATYPALNQILGAATTPDLRGRSRYTLNQGTGRLTAINGNTIFTAGGANSLVQANLPNVNFPVTDPTHNHGTGDAANPHFLEGNSATAVFYNLVPGVTLALPTPVSYTGATGASATGITVNSGGAGTAYIPPSIVGGITMIRAG